MFCRSLFLLFFTHVVSYFVPFEWLGVRVMVFHATLNNISVISWRSVLLVEETGGPGDNHRPATSYKLVLFDVTFYTCFLVHIYVRITI
jgi:hypothetical protein